MGPTPRWARPEGGDGGQHPTNVIEYGYPIGGMNWTGERYVVTLFRLLLTCSNSPFSACMFPVDAPDLGGFICSTTVVNGSLWRLGQVKSGDKVQFRRVSLEEALQVRQQQEDFLESITKYTAGQICAEQIVSAAQKASTSTSSSGAHKAVIQESTIDGAGNPFTVTFRQVRNTCSTTSEALMILTIQYRVVTITSLLSMVMDLSTLTIVAESRPSRMPLRSRGQTRKHGPRIFTRRPVAVTVSFLLIGPSTSTEY